MLRYARGMMSVDFLAVFPFHLFVNASEASFSGTHTQLSCRAHHAWGIHPFRGCNRARVGLSKLPRLLRLGRVTKKLDVFAAARVLRVVVLLIGFVVLAHIMACFWYFLGIQLIAVRINFLPF